MLEASDRAGGRNRTARGGDVLRELGPTGEPVTTHRCSFDDGLYLDLGPGRIPYHHRRVLDYCRAFGVDLEPYMTKTTANVVHLADGRGVRWRNRQVANDTRGRLAAMLAGTLEQRDAGAGELLESGFWRHSFYQPVDYLWQATMFQPVGGMDRIVTAFERELGSEFGEVVELNSEVTTIRLLDEGKAAVDYRRDGLPRTLVADYCVSSIPLPVLRGISTNFSAEFDAAIRAVEFASTCKVGWQAEERFWEGDADQIYGGIGWTNHPITQLWYPSNDYFSAAGLQAAPPAREQRAFLRAG
ncbi:Flavin containing amine oxidoreductase [Frankia torreyi]|uniref:Flavin containing amine oxidoreductase n=1 Tax=Frankia torreyi TaxID=1856 RepID=A0A0D8BFQ1_9ACTN|nr:MULTISPECIES: FAD-dependent oxidoreductase [Frankia]KJE22880.1 Flavin containing amine oxidoreductase [Frankia torreyi]